MDERTKNLIARFAEIQNISFEEAAELIGGENEENTLKNIEQFILKNINENNLKLNRKQRRALAKANRGKAREQHTKEEVDSIAETTKKLNYIDLIQKLRALNEKKEYDKNEAIEDGNAGV